jgi:hypothetical protein
MAKQSDHLVHRFPESLREILRRFFKDLEDSLTELRNRFDPNDPRFNPDPRDGGTLVTAMLIFAAIMLATVLAGRLILQAWPMLGAP